MILPVEAVPLAFKREVSAVLSVLLRVMLKLVLLVISTLAVLRL